VSDDEERGFSLRITPTVRLPTALLTMRRPTNPSTGIACRVRNTDSCLVAGLPMRPQRTFMKTGPRKGLSHVVEPCARKTGARRVACFDSLADDLETDPRNWVTFFRLPGEPTGIFRYEFITAPVHPAVTDPR
jgi:hypothetical protein